MNRFEMLTGKVTKREEGRRFSIYDLYDRELKPHDKALLCLSLVQSFNNIPYMTIEDQESAAAELMYLKTSQLKTIYKRVHHKEYEQKL